MKDTSDDDTELNEQLKDKPEDEVARDNSTQPLLRNYHSTRGVLVDLCPCGIYLNIQISK